MIPEWSARKTSPNLAARECWVNDALGPVVRDTDGRVFTLATLAELLTVEPFPALVREPSRP